jgi:hypothetical protein
MVLIFRLFHQVLYIVGYWDRGGRNRRRFDDAEFVSVQRGAHPLNAQKVFKSKKASWDRLGMYGTGRCRWRKLRGSFYLQI